MKVLIADDDPISLLYLQDALQDWGYQVIPVLDGTAACKVLLGDDPPDAAILDGMMPGMEGLEVCRAVRREKGPRFTYLIMVSSSGGPERVQNAKAAGADEYIFKPVDPDQLEKLLAAGCRIAELENRLRQAAPYDNVAGMHGRETIIGLLDNELRRSQRTQRPVSAIRYAMHSTLPDKAHAAPHASCRLIKEAGVRVRRVLRPYDLLGRLDENSTLVLLPDCDAASAREVAERALAEISSEPYAGSDQVIHPAVMIASATCEPADSGSAAVETIRTALLQRLDSALSPTKPGTPGTWGKMQGTDG